MVNVDVIGRIGKDAEILNGKKGDFVRFRMAVDDFQKGEKTTTWMGVIFSGDRAQRLAQYLKKGSAVYVRGTESVETYTDRNGVVQISREINAVDVDFIRLGGNGQGQSETPSEETTEVSTGKLVEPKAMPKAETTKMSDPPMEKNTDDEDDLPF